MKRLRSVRWLMVVALPLCLALTLAAAARAQDKGGKEGAAGEKGSKTAEAGKEKKMPLGMNGEMAVIETNLGTIKLKLFPDAAPKAVENFLGLAQKGYYNGVGFHRVIDGFMIQGGDPQGTGSGGESLWGKPFEDEFSPKHRFDKKGILAMANAGPRTNGSQFFITLGATPWLNDKHTIFGEVVSGLDVVEKIGKVKKGPRDKPLEPVVMKKVTVEQPAKAGAPKAGEEKGAKK